jgi:hypothetical protein
MQKHVARFAVLGALFLSTALTFAQPPAAFSPLDLRVPLMPQPLVAGGEVHLAYEVHITNMSSRPSTLESVEVWDATVGHKPHVLLRLEPDALAAAIHRFGAPSDDDNQRPLAPGQSAVLFVWLSVGKTNQPRRLTHHVSVTQPSAGGAGTDAIAIDGVPVNVDDRLPRAIDPPLRGDHWLAANGPDNTAGHRRSLLSLSGEARIAQRFAIDWVRLFDDGRTFRGDSLANTSYRAFGADVVAVADGVVVGAVGEIPENTPDLVARAVPMTPGTVVGNYILLDIGSRAWAVYGHLQRGSVLVRPGQTVRRGQTLARVGNTGNSTEPHLHFHIADRGSPLDSEGVPYAFSRFALEADGPEVTRALSTVDQSVQIDRASIATWFARAHQERRDEIPLLNAIVSFPAR